MNKKLLTFSLIAILTFVFAGFSFATDVVMDLNSPVSLRNETTDTSNNVDNSSIDSITNNAINESTTNELTVDDTIYSSDTDVTEDTSTEDIQEPTVTTTEYEDTGDLSITNMINIILIVVGIVLILLGIAIIIRLK